MSNVKYKIIRFGNHFKFEKKQVQKQKKLSHKIDEQTLLYRRHLRGKLYEAPSCNNNKVVKDFIIFRKGVVRKKYYFY
jgi:hypothetical protein